MPAVHSSWVVSFPPTLVAQSRNGRGGRTEPKFSYHYIQPRQRVWMCGTQAPSATLAAPSLPTGTSSTSSTTCTVAASSHPTTSDLLQCYHLYTATTGHCPTLLPPLLWPNLTLPLSTLLPPPLPLLPPPLLQPPLPQPARVLSPPILLPPPLL